MSKKKKNVTVEKVEEVIPTEEEVKETLENTVENIETVETTETDVKDEDVKTIEDTLEDETEEEVKEEELTPMTPHHIVTKKHELGYINGRSYKCIGNDRGMWGNNAKIFRISDYIDKK